MLGASLMVAFALILVLEGALPFMAPQAWRQSFRRMIALTDGQLRFIGLLSMLGGVLLLYLAHAGNG